MTEPGWADAVLILALLAPLVGLIELAGGIGEVLRGRLTQAGALVAATGWFALLVAGAGPDVGSFAPDQLALAAGVGAALVAAGAASFAGPAAAASLAVLSAGMAWGTDGRPSATALAVGLAGAWAIVVVARTLPLVPAVVAGAGAGAVALALLDVGDGPAGAGPLALLGTGAAVVVLVGGSRARQPVSLLSAGVLLASTRLLPGLADRPDPATGEALALGLAVAGTAAALCTLPGRLRPGLPPRLPSPVAAVALWSLAAAATPVPEARLVAVLLGAAALLLAAVPAPAALLAAVPGAAVLAQALAAGRGGILGPLAVLAGATALCLAAGAGGVAQEPDRDGAGLGAAPAALLALWLVAVPGSWAFAGSGDLAVYDRGAALAVAGGLVAMVLGGAASGRAPALGWLASLPVRPPPPERPARPERTPRRGVRARRRDRRAREAKPEGSARGAATSTGDATKRDADPATGDKDRPKRPWRR